MTTKKESIEKYQAYIKEHISNVKMVWKELKPLLKDGFWLDDYIYWKIDELIAKHDMSKSSVEEFPAYQMKFFPSSQDIPVNDGFNYAWNHHQKSNPHHWQYWIMWEPKGCVVLEMPLEYVLEMLCDWTAMSIKFSNKLSDWYKDNEPKMFLHKDTKRTIENWIPLFSKVLGTINKESNEVKEDV